MSPLARARYQKLRVTDKTANYTLTYNDAQGLFTNVGATGTINFTLPSTGVILGQYYDIAVEANQMVLVTPGASDGIIYDGVQRADAQPIILYEIGHAVRFVADTALNWFAYSLRRPVGNYNRIVLYENFQKKPSIQTDATNATAATRQIANKDFNVVGTNGTTALDTFRAGGGITITTAGADGDQMIIAPHLDTNMTAWASINWATDDRVVWGCRIVSGASIASTIIWAGLKLSNTPVKATDADSVFLRYQNAVNSGIFETVDSIGATLVSTNSATAAVVVSTNYDFEIYIDGGRVARTFINGTLARTTLALTTAVNLIPYIGVSASGAAAAKAISIRDCWISKDRT